MARCIVSVLLSARPLRPSQPPRAATSKRQRAPRLMVSREFHMAPTVSNVAVGARSIVGSAFMWAALVSLPLALGCGAAASKKTACDGLVYEDHGPKRAEYLPCAGEMMATLDRLAPQIENMLSGEEKARSEAQAAVRELRGLLKKAGWRGHARAVGRPRLDESERRYLECLQLPRSLHDGREPVVRPSASRGREAARTRKVPVRGLSTVVSGCEKRVSPPAVDEERLSRPRLRPRAATWLHVMSQVEPSGRVSLLAGLSAAFIAGAFAYLHRAIFLDWPVAALDGPGAMLAYFTAGTVFQFGIPVLCLAAFIFGAPARHQWTARIGLACAATALLGYALYVRSCLEMLTP